MGILIDGKALAAQLRGEDAQLKRAVELMLETIGPKRSGEGSGKK